MPLEKECRREIRCLRRIKDLYGFFFMFTFQKLLVKFSCGHMADFLRNMVLSLKGLRKLLKTVCVIPGMLV